MQYKVPDDIKNVSEKVSLTNRDALAPKILAASGPYNNGHDKNPHWISNNPQAWGQEFATRMTSAVADAIDDVAKANKNQAINLSPPFEELASTIQEYVGETLRTFSDATAGLQRRTNLLWWKEALYSLRTRKSYRVMDPFTAASIMALDLFDQVPLFSPASVSAFLHEAILLLPKVSSANAVEIPTIIESLLHDTLAASLRETARDLEPSGEGRGPLLALLGQPALESLSGASFRKMTGLDPQIQMSPDAWGAHLFQELQAARAIQANSATPKRRKG
jgi:hypothetical protein